MNRNITQITAYSIINILLVKASIEAKLYVDYLFDFSFSFSHIYIFDSSSPYFYIGAFFNCSLFHLSFYNTYQFLILLHPQIFTLFLFRLLWPFFFKYKALLCCFFSAFLVFLWISQNTFFLTDRFVFLHCC